MFNLTWLIYLILPGEARVDLSNTDGCEMMTWWSQQQAFGRLLMPCRYGAALGPPGVRVLSQQPGATVTPV